MTAKLDPAEEPKAARTSLVGFSLKPKTAIGIAVFTTVISGISGSRMTAFHGAFLAAAIFALVASLCAVRLIHDEDAVEIMVSTRARATLATAD